MLVNENGDKYITQLEKDNKLGWTIFIILAILLITGILV